MSFTRRPELDHDWQWLLEVKIHYQVPYDLTMETPVKNSLKSLLHAISNFFAIFPPFAQSQFYKQKLGNKVGAEERPRTASELKKIQQNCYLFSLQVLKKYFVLRETEVHNTNWLCFFFLISLFIWSDHDLLIYKINIYT